MKCRKLYGNHLVKLLNRSHARSSNMNSSDDLLFSTRPCQMQQQWLPLVYYVLWYVATDQWNSLQNVLGRIFYRSLDAAKYVGTKLFYAVSPCIRAISGPPSLENVACGCKRLVSGQEFHPRNLIEGTRYLFVPWKSSLSPFSLTIVDNRVLRIVSLDPFHENREIRVSSFKGGKLCG